MTPPKLLSHLQKDDSAYITSSSVIKDDTPKLLSYLQKDDSAYVTSSSVIKNDTPKTVVLFQGEDRGVQFLIFSGFLEGNSQFLSFLLYKFSLSVFNLILQPFLSSQYQKFLKFSMFELSECIFLIIEINLT